MRIGRLLAAGILLAALACGRDATSGSQRPARPPPSPQVVKSLSPDPSEEFGYDLPPMTMFRPLGQEGCEPPSPLVVAESLATSDEIVVWALLSVSVPPSKLAVGDEAKMIWRSSGSGDFDVYAISPAGKTVRSDPPITSHGGSNWERPGDEWGSYFELFEPGCWEFRVQHGTESARLWLDIDDAESRAGG